MGASSIRCIAGAEPESWCRSRGMYTFADRYRRVPVSPAALANALYSPSYVSGLWALGFYGLIPEGVSSYTSVTTRTAAEVR